MADKLSKSNVYLETHYEPGDPGDPREPEGQDAADRGAQGLQTGLKHM